eukprot:COSAG01_NODE_7041_length_3380_cov_6.993600_4_plen_107_part_00
MHTDTDTHSRGRHTHTVKCIVENRRGPALYLLRHIRLTISIGIAKHIGQSQPIIQLSDRDTCVTEVGWYGPSAFVSLGQRIRSDTPFVAVLVGLPVATKPSGRGTT